MERTKKTINNIFVPWSSSLYRQRTSSHDLRHDNQSTFPLRALTPSFPCFLIVNIDSSHMDGSHWIGLGIFKDALEIFDPLGFNILNWPRIPCGLLDFLHNFSRSRNVKILPRIQSDSSMLCGIFSIYYVIRRKTATFDTCLNCFNFENFVVNDGVVCNFFK